MVASLAVGCAGGPGGSDSLTTWQPPRAQDCRPNIAPDALPELGTVVDADALSRQLEVQLEGLDGGYVVLDVTRDSTGAWREAEIRESDVPPDVAAQVDAAVEEHLVPGPAEGLRLVMRVDLEDPPRTRIGPVIACAPVIRNREDVIYVMQRVGRDVGVEGTVVLLVEVLEDGTPGSIRVHESSGSQALDAAMVQAAQFVRFHPAMNRGRPFTAWAAFPFRITVGR